MFHQDWEITWYLENLMNDRCGCGEFGSLAAHSKAEWNRQVWLGGFIQSWFGINRVWTDVYSPQIGQLSKLFNVDALWRGEWLEMQCWILSLQGAGGLKLIYTVFTQTWNKSRAVTRTLRANWEGENVRICAICAICEPRGKSDPWLVCNPVICAH